MPRGRGYAPLTDWLAFADRAEGGSPPPRPLPPAPPLRVRRLVQLKEEGAKAGQQRGHAHRPRRDHGAISQVTSSISFPEILDMAEHCVTKPPRALTYRLTAVLMHAGASANSGHYTARIVEPAGGSLPPVAEVKRAAEGAAVAGEAPGAERWWSFRTEHAPCVIEIGEHQLDTCSIPLEKQ